MTHPRNFEHLPWYCLSTYFAGRRTEKTSLGWRMSASSNAATCTDAQQDSAAPCNLHAQIPANFEFQPVRSALATRLPMTATYQQEMRGRQLLATEQEKLETLPPVSSNHNPCWHELSTVSSRERKRAACARRRNGCQLARSLTPALNAMLLTWEQKACILRPCKPV